MRFRPRHLRYILSSLLVQRCCEIQIAAARNSCKHSNRNTVLQIPTGVKRRAAEIQRRKKSVKGDFWLCLNCVFASRRLCVEIICGKMPLLSLTSAFGSPEPNRTAVRSKLNTIIGFINKQSLLYGFGPGPA